ncbi:hypothetical protein WKK05_11430 [Nostoc sp. UHCC 0302]|uniref:hypothetical protein n=1 Tax=Nostoc sp. UHCC 0302 TaxID=3134896 RepID=UPI00311C946B
MDFSCNSDNTPPASSAEDIFEAENPATATITVTAVEIPELTEQEIRDRLHWSERWNEHFLRQEKRWQSYAMGLRPAVGDRRLYRSTHRTFEEYCRDRFGHSRRQSYLLMDAAVVFDNLIEKCDQFDHILPAAEGQVRPMTKLEPQQQQEVWLKAVEQAGGKVPPARIVKNVVQQIMERTQVPNSYQLGEVCQILAKDNPELRGKSGCWAIVSQVNDFSCTVRTWDGELTVGVQHLKSYDYLPNECEQMQVICDGGTPSFADRINRVYSSGLEESVQKFLESLGKLKRAYLTGL